MTRSRRRRNQPWLGPQDPLLRYAAICGILAMALTLWVGASGAPMPGDVWLAKRIQDAPGMGDLAGLVNVAGNWPLQGAATALAVAVAFFHRHPKRLRHETFFAFGAALLLRFWDQLLKVIVRSPRPGEDFGLRVDYLRDSYGFPSGHVYSDVLVYGLVAVFAAGFLPRAWAMGLRTAIISLLLLAGPARVYVGAHWPSDVVGGYLWGTAALLMAVAFGRAAAKRV
ncbi:MAG: phosphatase PAP2 family protein [Chloroflexi bacterium]|nr:phosphatase PAP2 family protein [Chloroflexota bacterium]